MKIRKSKKKNKFTITNIPNPELAAQLRANGHKVIPNKKKQKRKFQCRAH